MGAEAGASVQATLAAGRLRLPGVARGEAAAALRAAQAGTWEGSVACATGRRSLRRGGGLAGEASGGGWSECGGCPGNALRWLP